VWLGLCSVSKRGHTPSWRRLCLVSDLHFLNWQHQTFNVYIPRLPPQTFSASLLDISLSFSSSHTAFLQDLSHPITNMQRSLMKRQKKRKDKPVQAPLPVPVSLNLQEQSVILRFGELEIFPTLTYSSPLWHPHTLSPQYQETCSATLHSALIKSSRNTLPWTWAIGSHAIPLIT
jgi:hypothetical protein